MSYVVQHSILKEEDEVTTYPNYQTIVLKFGDSVHQINFALNGKSIIQLDNSKIIELSPTSKPILIISKILEFSSLQDNFQNCLSFNNVFFYISPQNIQEQICCSLLITLKEDLNIRIQDPTLVLISQTKTYNNFVKENPSIFSSTPLIFKYKNYTYIFFDDEEDYSQGIETNIFETIWFNKIYEYYCVFSTENKRRLNELNLPYFTYHNVIYIDIDPKTVVLSKHNFIQQISFDDVSIDPINPTEPCSLKLSNSKNIDKETISKFNPQIFILQHSESYFYYSTQEDRFNHIKDLIKLSPKDSSPYGAFEFLLNYPSDYSVDFFRTNLSYYSFIFQSRYLFSPYMNEARTLFVLYYYDTQTNLTEFKLLNSTILNGSYQMYMFPSQAFKLFKFNKAGVSYVFNKDQINLSEKEKEQFLLNLINKGSDPVYDNLPALITDDHAISYLMFPLSNIKGPFNFRSILQENHYSSVAYIIGNFHPSFLILNQRNLHDFFPNSISVEITHTAPLKLLVVTYPTKNLAFQDFDALDSTKFIRGKICKQIFSNTFYYSMINYIKNYVSDQRKTYELPYSPNLDSIHSFFSKNQYYSYILFGHKYSRFTEQMWISINPKDAVSQQFFKQFNIGPKNCEE